MISCKDAVARLWTYLDRALGASQERELEEHLGLCRHCCGELEFARQVRERLRASGAAAALTPEAQERLDGFLKRLAVGEKEGR